MTEKTNKLSNIINIPTPDPEDARRRRLLNIMLLAVAIGALLALAALLISAPMGLAGEQEEVRALVFGIALALFGVAAIYALNRYVSGELAGALFLLLLIALAAFSDEPREVVDGRGLLVFTIPILAASVLLRPWASFVAAGLSGLAIIAVGLGVPGHFPNVPAIVALFIVASVSWLSARSLERALEDSRASSEALRESEEQYRQLIETMQEGIWTIDQDAYTTFVNPRMAEMLGYTVEEMLGKHLFSFMDEDGVEIAKRNLERRRQGIKEQHEFESLRQDGTRVYALLATSPLTDADGNYIGAIAGVLDITERQRAEEELVRAAEEWRTTFDATNDAIWILDQDQRVLRSNKAAERLFQRSGSEMIGKHCWEIVHGTAQPIPECPILRAKHSLRRETMELPIGESWFQVTVDPLLDMSGRYAGAVHMVSDITERVRVEEELRDTTERLLKAQRIAKMGFLDWNLKTNEVIWSDQIYDLYGLDKQVEKSNIDLTMQLVHPDDLEFVEKNLEKAIKGEKEYDIDHRKLRPDGKVIWVHAQAELVLDADGDPESLLGTVVDITERKRAEEELREHREHLEEMVEERTAELRKTVNLMAGREVRMAGLKKAIKKLRAQLEEAGLPPVADDPLLAERGREI